MPKWRCREFLFLQSYCTRLQSVWHSRFHSSRCICDILVVNSNWLNLAMSCQDKSVESRIRFLLQARIHARQQQAASENLAEFHSSWYPGVWTRFFPLFCRRSLVNSNIRTLFLSHFQLKPATSAFLLNQTIFRWSIAEHGPGTSWPPFYSKFTHVITSEHCQHNLPLIHLPQTRTFASCDNWSVKYHA